MRIVRAGLVPGQLFHCASNYHAEAIAYVDILQHPEIRESLKEYSNWPTYPQLYVKGELVGGCDIVVEMYHSGELKELLSEPDTA